MSRIAFLSIRSLWTLSDVFLNSLVWWRSEVYLVVYCTSLLYDWRAQEVIIHKPRYVQFNLKFVIELNSFLSLFCLSSYLALFYRPILEIRNLTYLLTWYGCVFVLGCAFIFRCLEMSWNHRRDWPHFTSHVHCLQLNIPLFISTWGNQSNSS